MPEKICLYAENIDKVYPGTLALDKVCFNVHKGKVNVLVGENGAGKSTLMKILAGIEQPTNGKIYYKNEEISFSNTSEARSKGIGIIHQELSLFPNLNVYQNIFMGNEITKAGKVDNREHRRKTKEVLERLEYPISPEEIVGNLRVGEQQMVEIARNLIQDDLQILIMDEPTSSLSAGEVEVLFKIMKELTDEGISIIYISHRLEEIMQIGDYVTVLRDGKLISEAKIEDIDISWIVQEMVGEKKSFPKRDRDVDWSTVENILEIQDLSLPGPHGRDLLNNVSFNLKKGEVLGIYGLMGAGRTEVVECLMGMRPEHTGTVVFQGKEMEIKSLSEQIEQGFAWVPEDRQREGLVQTMNICQNIVLANLSDYQKLGFLSSEKVGDAADKMIDEVRIKVSDKNLPILSLSGGNQQKVVISKGLLTDPKILFMDEPSRGIDIGAKSEVFEIINKYAQQGLSIVVISSELEEIEAIADRIIVLSGGYKTAELSGDDITQDNLVLASYKGCK